MDAYSHTIVSAIIKIKYSALSFLLFMGIVYLDVITLNSFFLFLIFSATLYNLLLFYKSSSLINWDYYIDSSSIKVYIKEFYEYTHPLFTYMLIGTMITMFDFWLLQTYGGLKEQGYFGLAFQIALISSILTSSMTPLISREFSKDYKLKKLKRMQLIFKKYIPQFYVLSSFFAMFLFYYSDIFVILIAGDKFNDSIILLSLMAFYPLHQTYGQLSSSIFFSTDRTKQYRNTSTFFALLGLPLSYLLIVYLELGALGLVIKILLVQFVLTNYHLILNCKFLNLQFYKFFAHQLYIPLILYTFISISDSLILVENTYVQMLVTFSIYLALTTTTYYLLKKYRFTQKMGWL